MERRALGKGLNALIPETERAHQERVENIPVEQISPNPYQPRDQIVDNETLQELKNSIKEKGVIQPIIVRRRPNGYELIAGERRWQAAKRLNLLKIPALVKEIQDEESLELSLIENIQRQDLSSIEEARAYKYLIDKFNLTQEKISQIVGKSRSSIANILRLLNLPQEIQDAIRKGSISMAHGRLLLEVPEVQEQMRFYREIIANSLSIRELENITRGKRGFRIKRISLPKTVDRNLIAVQDELQKFLGTKVRIIHQRKRGKVQIEFYSMEDLKRIIKLIVS